MRVITDILVGMGFLLLFGIATPASGQSGPPHQPISPALELVTSVESAQLDRAMKAGVSPNLVKPVAGVDTSQYRSFDNSISILLNLNLIGNANVIRDQVGTMIADNGLTLVDHRESQAGIATVVYVYEPSEDQQILEIMLIAFDRSKATEQIRKNPKARQMGGLPAILQSAIWSAVRRSPIAQRVEWVKGKYRLPPEAIKESLGKMSLAELKTSVATKQDQYPDVASLQGSKTTSSPALSAGESDKAEIDAMLSFILDVESFKGMFHSVNDFCGPKIHIEISKRFKQRWDDNNGELMSAQSKAEQAYLAAMRGRGMEAEVRSRLMEAKSNAFTKARSNDSLYKDITVITVEDDKSAACARRLASMNIDQMSFKKVAPDSYKYWQTKLK